MAESYSQNSDTGFTVPGSMFDQTVGELLHDLERRKRNPRSQDALGDEFIYESD